ncbi:hypothetical protein AB0I68_31110 [Streptomyces sp. NPDC050448]|uniref:hypothetical protein n=1 Tax=Streptomyces sp. NPDC050448 TaxID=3155404 RepID=UPI0034246BE4
MNAVWDCAAGMARPGVRIALEDGAPQPGRGQPLGRCDGQSLGDGVANANANANANAFGAGALRASRRRP